MTKIYESPDGGKTVYVRDSGATNRTLVSDKYVDSNIIIEMRETQLWNKIRLEAKTNPGLKKELDRVVAWYHLLCDNKDSSK